MDPTQLAIDVQRVIDENWAIRCTAVIVPPSVINEVVQLIPEPERPNNPNLRVVTFMGLTVIVNRHVGNHMVFIDHKGFIRHIERIDE